MEETFEKAHKHSRKRKYALVVTVLVIKVDAQNAVIQWERFFSKTSPSFIRDSVYGQANPVTSERSLITLIHLDIKTPLPVTAHQSNAGRIMTTLDCHTA